MVPAQLKSHDITIDWDGKEWTRWFWGWDVLDFELACIGWEHSDTRLVHLLQCQRNLSIIRSSQSSCQVLARGLAVQVRCRICWIRSRTSCENRGVFSCLDRPRRWWPWLVSPPGLSLFVTGLSAPQPAITCYNQLWSGMILRTIACNKMPTGFSKLPRSRGSFALADSEWGGAPAMGMMVVMLVPGSRTSSVFSETKNAPMASHGHNWWFIGFERILQVCQGIFPHFWTTPPGNQIPSPTKDGTLHRKAKPSKSALPWCLGQYSELSYNCFITCHLIIKSYMIIN